MALGAHLDRKCLIMLLDGRIITGIMRSFDQHGNIVLQNAWERFLVGNLYCDHPLGILLARAENVTLIGDLDSSMPELPPQMTAVSLKQILTAKKAENESLRLKRTMKKWMEFVDDV